MKKEDIERDRTFYSNIWDDPKPTYAEFEPTFEDESEPGPEILAQTHDPYSEIGSQEAYNADSAIRPKTEKLFNIANNQNKAKYVDWKDSTLHRQIKEKNLINYEKQEIPKYYKPSDVGTPL